MEQLQEPRRSPRILVRIILYGLPVLAACEAGPPLFSELYPTEIHSHITGELAGSLSPDGRLILAGPEPRDYPQVSAQRAGELALVFARTYGPHIRGYLERDHGRSIAFEDLRIGSPAYYAATPYAAVPAHAPPAMRNAYGPYYLVYLVNAVGAPALVVAVAAHTEASVVEGRLAFPASYGGDFFANGVRPEDGFAMPPSPEHAVRLSSLATGALVAAVPELVLGSREYHPVHARWKVTLDRPVRARLQDGTEVPGTRIVYVGLRGELLLPAGEQPADVLITLDPLTRETVRLPRHPDRPLAFHRATFAGQ